MGEAPEAWRKVIGPRLVKGVDPPLDNLDEGDYATYTEYLSTLKTLGYPEPSLAALPPSFVVGIGEWFSEQDWFGEYGAAGLPLGYTRFPVEYFGEDYGEDQEGWRTRRPYGHHEGSVPFDVSDNWSEYDPSDLRGVLQGNAFSKAFWSALKSKIEEVWGDLMPTESDEIPEEKKKKPAFWTSARKKLIYDTIIARLLDPGSLPADVVAKEKEMLKERLELKKTAQERAAQERAAQERAAQERAAQERAAQERAAQERAARERAARERAARERAARERAAESESDDEVLDFSKVRAAQARAAQKRAADSESEDEALDLSKVRAARERAAQARAARAAARIQHLKDAVGRAEENLAAVAKTYDEAKSAVAAARLALAAAESADSDDDVPINRSYRQSAAESSDSDDDDAPINLLKRFKTAAALRGRSPRGYVKDWTQSVERLLL